MKYLIFLFILLISVAVVSAAEYGFGPYGGGLYGVGDAGNTGGGGAGGGGGGAGGGGGGSTTSALNGGTFTNSPPDSVNASVNNFQLTFRCADSGTCRTTVSEVAVSGLPSSVTLSGAQAVAAIDLDCTGDFGQTTMSFTFDTSSGLTCDNLVAMHFHDGTSEPLTINGCSNGAASVSFNGCSYIVFGEKGAAPTQPVAQPETQPSASTGAAQQSQPSAPSQAVKPSRWGLVLVILGVIVILVIGYVVFNRKKNKF